MGAGVQGGKRYFLHFVFLIPPFLIIIPRQEFRNGGLHAVPGKGREVLYSSSQFSDQVLDSKSTRYATHSRLDTTPRVSSLP